MEKHLPKVEGEPYSYKAWPSWATGPNGETAIFDSEAEVPAGWSHHGTKKGAKAAAPVQAPVDDAGETAEVVAPVKKSGRPKKAAAPLDL